MDEYTPTQVARLLGIEGATLRQWRKEFATFLSPAAAVSGRNARPRYSANDLALLRNIQAQLRNGSTYAQVRATLGGVEASPSRSPQVDTPPIVGLVEVIEPSDQQEALAQLVEAQRATIEALRHVAEVQRSQIDALERGLAAAEQRTETERQRADQDRADLITALERARADETRALEALRSTLSKVPRWLRTLLGIGIP